MFASQQIFDERKPVTFLRFSENKICFFISYISEYREEMITIFFRNL